MKALVFIGPTVTGFDNAAGSEQRYLMCLAEMLAANGWEVTCAGSNAGGGEAPEWGHSTPSSNVRFVHMVDVVHEQDSIVYDLAIVSENFTHWRVNGVPQETPCSWYEPFAKVIAHALFGWAGRGLPCCEGENPKHYVFHPFEPHVRLPADVLVDYPVYDQIPEIRPEERNTICFPMKGLFMDEWPKDMSFHFGALKCLKAVERLSREHDTRVVIVQSEYWETERAKRLGAYDLYQSLKHRIAHRGLINRSELDAEFLKSRCSVVAQGYFSSAFQAPSKGAVPLYFNDDTGNVWHPENRYLDMRVDDEVFYRALERFYIDDDYYRECLGKSLKIIEKFKWSNSFNSLMKFMETI